MTTDTPQRPDPLAGPLRATFDALAHANVSYVVLRGYLPTGELAQSADVDVYVPPQDLPAAAAVLGACGWRERRHQTGRYPHVFFDIWNLGGRLVTVFDIVTGVYFGEHLLELEQAESVIATSELVDGVRVPNPWLAAFLFALHVVFDKGELSVANRGRARVLVELCRARSADRHVLVATYGEGAAVLLSSFAEAVAREGFHHPERLRHQARRLDLLRPHPLLARGTRLRARVRQLIRRPVRVALLGPDGSGKSSLVDGMLHESGPLPIGGAYLGVNQFLTPPARWFQRRLERYRKAGRDRAFWYRVLSNLNALWWPLELLARMKRADRGRAVVFYDRYPFREDAAAHQRRSTIGSAMAAYGILWRRLLPQPDIVVLLDGDPRIIWARKREYPFETHLEVQEACRRALQGARAERHVVRTDRDPADSLAELKVVLAASPVVASRLYRS